MLALNLPLDADELAPTRYFVCSIEKPKDQGEDHSNWLTKDQAT